MHTAVDAEIDDKEGKHIISSGLCNVGLHFAISVILEFNTSMHRMPDPASYAKEDESEIALRWGCFS
jgi:hypothetical protein